MQHKFLQNIRCMITDTIIDNQDVYENAIQPKPKKVAATSTIGCEKPEKPERSSASSPAKSSPPMLQLTIQACLPHHQQRKHVLALRQK